MEPHGSGGYQVIEALVVWVVVAFCAWCLCRAAAMADSRLKDIRAFGGNVDAIKRFKASDLKPKGAK